MALRAAAAAAGGWRLDGHTLVVTLEPCTMCAGAIIAARISRLVYGAADPKAGAAGSLWDVLRDRRLRHRTEVWGVCSPAECGALLRDFFAQRRPTAAGPQQADGLAESGRLAAVESPSGRGRTPRKRVKAQVFRGFKSHLHRH